MSPSGIDVTIEGEITREASKLEVSTSQGFSAGFPSSIPTTEVGESSGMDLLQMCRFIVVLSFSDNN